MVLLPITAAQNSWAMSRGYSSYQEYMYHECGIDIATNPDGAHMPPHMLRQHEAKEQGYSSVREMWAAKGHQMPHDAGDNWAPTAVGQHGQWLSMAMPKGTTKGVKGGNWRKPGAPVLNNGTYVGAGYGQAEVPHESANDKVWVEGKGWVSSKSGNILVGPGYEHRKGTNPKGGEHGHVGNPGKGIVGLHSTQSGDQQIWWHRSTAKGDNIVAPKGNPKGGKHDKSREYVPSHKGHWRNSGPRSGWFLLAANGSGASIFVPYGSDLQPYLQQGYYVAGEGDENKDWAEWTWSLENVNRDGIQYDPNDKSLAFAKGLLGKKGAGAGVKGVGEKGKGEKGFGVSATAIGKGPAGYPMRPPGMPPMMPPNAAGAPPTGFHGWDKYGEPKFSYPNQSALIDPQISAQSQWHDYSVAAQQQALQAQHDWSKGHAPQGTIVPVPAQPPMPPQPPVAESPYVEGSAFQALHDPNVHQTASSDYWSGNWGGHD